MTTLILIIGCTFIAGLTAALLSADFFAGALIALLLGGHATLLNYYKFLAQNLNWIFYFLVPLILIAAVCSAGLGTAFSGPDSGMLGSEGDGY